MKDFLTRLAGWFTDSRRAGAQALVASLASLLVVLGAVSDAQSKALLDLSASGLLAVQGALGLMLLRRSDVYTWLNTTGRGVVYALGGAIGAAGFAFELWSEDTSALIVQVATVLASILVAAVQMVNVGTLSTPPAGDPPDELPTRFASARAATVAAVSADAERPVEASPSTYAKERKPQLRVGVFWPGLPRVSSDDVVRAADAAFPGVDTVLYVLTTATAFRGLVLDVVLVTVPLTRALIEAFEPNVATSVYDGARVQHLEVS